MSDSIKDILAKKTLKTPTSPGVYLMKDKNGDILYVGKAKNLRSRLSSYFRRKEKDSLKTSILVSRIRDFDTILTSNEKEAFLLEASLIKKHKPKYNIILKDDKNYPYVRLDMNHPFPNLSIARKSKNDGAIYFGPFSSAKSIRLTLKLIHKVFKLRDCKNTVFEKRDRPCLNYQMGRCLGPCVFDIEKKEYMKHVREATLVLKGKSPFLLKKLEKEMKRYAASQEFEKAAEARDKFLALKHPMEKQSVVTKDLRDKDVISISGNGINNIISLLKIRGGYISDKRNFEFVNSGLDKEDIMESFLRQYYERAGHIPKEIYLNVEINEKEMTEEFISSLKGGRCVILNPSRGDKKDLLNLASENAESALRDLNTREDTKNKLLNELKLYLGMKTLPLRIECFDNSNISGTNPVSSMVVYENGKPAVSEYRRYTLGYRGVPDDYAFMNEALTRRFEKDDKPKPDLLMVDGGKGQLNIALDILSRLGLENEFLVIGLAKKNENAGETGDKVYLPGRMNPLFFHNKKHLIYFLMQIRDAAHNNVINFHRKKRSKAMKISILDDIKGVGSKRKKAILSHFKSFKKIREATLDELKSVEGIPDAVAEDIYKRFH